MRAQRTCKGKAAGNALCEDHYVRGAVHDVLVRPPLAGAAHPGLDLLQRCWSSPSRGSGPGKHAHTGASERGAPRPL